MTPLRFASIGFDSYVCANRILCFINPGTAPARRQLKQAKETDRFLDMTLGRPAKCLLLLDDGL